jgi:hypothetical protein
MYDRVQMLFP